MNDRERLLLLLHTSGWEIFSKPVSDNTEKIADYLLANGVIVLPCKVGDTVFVHKSTTTLTYHLIGWNYFKRKPTYTADKKISYSIKEFVVPDFDWIISRLKDFGKTVFLTREEAEQALKKLKDGDIK